eukprot:scaffold144077_cov31-Tisochrysis_lutea.AAC.4
MATCCSCASSSDGNGADRSTRGGSPVARSTQPWFELAGRVRRSSGAGERSSRAASMESVHAPAEPSAVARAEVVV